MGSPKKHKKKYSKPSHPWNKERILAEKEIMKDFGLRRKYEIWKMNSILKNFTSQAKNLITTKTPQSDKERSQLLTKLSSLGLVDSDAKIEDVLALNLRDVMERRLQTLVHKKNLARSLIQARQFIAHEHISIGSEVVTSPSYIVPLNKETDIQFTQNSSFLDPKHPERKVEEKVTRSKKIEIGTNGKDKKTGKKIDNGKKEKIKEKNSD